MGATIRLCILHVKRLVRSCGVALKFLLAGIALAPFVALGESVTLTWTLPTTGVMSLSGTTVPIAPEDLAVTTVEYGSCLSTELGVAFGVPAGRVVIPSPDTMAVIDRPPGVHCFRMTWRMAIEKGGLTSDYSPVIQKVIPGPVTPNPPTDFSTANDGAARQFLPVNQRLIRWSGPRGEVAHLDRFKLPASRVITPSALSD